MKGVPGLIIAATLGVAGGICNWLYIARQAEDYEKESFVKIGVDRIQAGEEFTRGDFDKVEIPQRNLGNLDKIAIRWEDLSTIIGQTAVKNYVSNQLVLQEDLRTPPHEDLNHKIGPNEVATWVPVDPRSFNPQHVNPGDMVSFRVPASLGVRPSPAGQPVGAQPQAQSGGGEIIGPFRILALGNRMGSPEAARAAGQRFGSENIITVSVEVRDGELEPKAQRLFEIRARTNFKGVQVLLHPAEGGT